MSENSIEFKRLARRLARVEQAQANMSKPQLAYSSIENGNIKAYDGDKLVSSTGVQEDGSGATRFFDGPIPPVPSGFTALADGPLIQGTWDGTFEDGAQATYDLAYLEFAATLVENSGRVSFATISAKEGASATVVANKTGLWTVAVRSVSQAGKKSEFFSAGTVEVKITDLSGAISAVQDSANGKNKVHYEPRPPTPADPGIFDDTWFVGQVGRPEDVVEATNLWLGSKLSEDRSSVSTNSWNDGVVQTAEGLEITIGTTSDSNTSVSYTNGGYRVQMEPGLPYSFVVPVKNTGAVPFSTKVSFYLSSGGIYPDPVLIQPGETHVFAAESAVLAGGGDFRWSLRYDSGDPRPPQGAKITLLDGITCVQSATAPDPFNGDTESGLTDNESHYRWAGAPYSSPSEKYLPALTIGESDTWNVIEQWRHNGTSWERVELSHMVISTLDLGKVTAGQINAIRIESNTIGTEQLRADFADFVVARGGTFITTNGNGEFSDRGLFFQQPDGTAVMRVPTDGGPISLSASDTQIRRAQVDELEMVAGNVRSGGTLTLRSGVTPPASPPELNSQWNRFASLEPLDINLAFDWLGLAYWGEGSGHWVRAINVLGAEGDSRDTIEVYDYATGVFQKEIHTGINPRAGVTVIGDIVYTIGPGYSKFASAPQYMHGYNLVTGQLVSAWDYTHFFASDQKKIAIGNDGTNVLVAGVAPNGILYVFRYSPSTGAQPGPEMTVNFDTGRDTDIYGVGVSGGKYYVSPAWQVREYTVSGSILNWTGFAWDNPNKSGTGFVWKDSHPYIVDASGEVYAGSGFASDDTVQACFTWFDGTYETTPSPIASVSLPARRSVSISMAKRAGLQKRIYIKSSGQGAWARYLVDENVTVYVEDTGNAGLYQLPTVNTFPNSTPATMKSANGNFEAKGDGSGHWGPLTFNADGSMAGIPKMAHGTVVLTPTADNTTVTAAVTFPEGRFTTPPSVVVSADTTVPGTNVLGVSSTNISATSFDAVLRRTNAVASRMYWIAMEA